MARRPHRERRATAVPVPAVPVRRERRATDVPGAGATGAAGPVAGA
ncbi:hypothetical protein [Micromonospora sp. AP08]|nr:hypothetical protein [Micromonospora sp. AP08]